MLATAAALDIALALACDGMGCPITIMATLRTAYGITLDNAMRAAAELVKAGVVSHT